MKKILIIGSNSFSGSHFVNLLLNKKIKVFGMSRSREPRNEFLPYKNNKNLKNFIFHQFDLNKKNDRTKILKVIKKNNIKNIINNFHDLDQKVKISKQQNDENPRQATEDFVEKIKNENIDSYLHVSTPEVYGDLRETIYENSSKKPSTPYAISRLAMDYHLEAIAKMNKFPVKFSRAANVYGEGQKLYRIIPKTIIKILKNEKILLHGSGSSKRSFLI